MTRREYLTEQYEDALFALLMEPVAISEGIKAEEENERLRNDAAAAVPASLRNKCIKTIKKHYAKREMRKNGRTASKLIARVAIVAMILVLLMTTAFALSPTLRTKAMNWLVESFADHTRISVTSQNENMIEDTKVNDILPGFYLIEEKCGPGFEYSVYESHDTNAKITITSFATESGVLTVDTEDTAVERVSLFGEDVLIVEKEGIIQALLKSDNNCILEVKGENICREDVLSVLEKMCG